MQISAIFSLAVIFATAVSAESPVQNTGQNPGQTSTTTRPCPIIDCFRKGNPVCGSDGNTYPSACMLTAAKCKYDNQNPQTPLTVVSKGPCPRKCDTICTLEDIVAPVCGSDSVTYGNKCLFDIAQCKAKATNTSLTLSYNGPCDKCNKICTKEYAPVCGSDKVTYGNKCQFDIAQCKVKGKGISLTVSYNGQCTKCNKACAQIYNPVCGTDFNTYSNECLLNVAKCERNLPDLAVMQPGACPACKTVCSKEYKPVCGSDGNTYSNQCVFEAARCTKKDSCLKIVKYTACSVY